MDKGKNRRKNQFGVVTRKKDGTWDVWRRNSLQERGGKNTWISPHISPLTISAMTILWNAHFSSSSSWSFLKYLIKTVPTERRAVNSQIISATKQVENLSRSSWRSFMGNPRRLQVPARPAQHQSEQDRACMLWPATKTMAFRGQFVKSTVLGRTLAPSTYRTTHVLTYVSKLFKERTA